MNAARRAAAVHDGASGWRATAASSGDRTLSRSATTGTNGLIARITSPRRRHTSGRPTHQITSTARGRRVGGALVDADDGDDEHDDHEEEAEDLADDLADSPAGEGDPASAARSAGSSVSVAARARREAGQADRRVTAVMSTTNAPM